MTTCNNVNSVNFIILTLRDANFSNKKISEFLWQNYIEKNNTSITIQIIMEALEKEHILKQLISYKYMKSIEMQIM